MRSNNQQLVTRQVLLLNAAISSLIFDRFYSDLVQRGCDVISLRW